jgi:transcription initiation factor TFIIIB Brf1 subunit/transcription initiation factor TFIIB
MERCSNCSRPISTSETPFVFEEKIVCARCHAVLTEKMIPYVPEARTYEAPARAVRRTLYEDPDIRVTAGQLTVGGRSYDLATISAARLHIIPASHGMAVGLAGISVGLVVFLLLQKLINGRWSITLIVLIPLAVAGAIYQYCSEQPVYGLGIQFSMQDRVLFHSPDRKRLQSAVDAVNAALAESEPDDVDDG